MAFLHAMRCQLLLSWSILSPSSSTRFIARDEGRHQHRRIQEEEEEEMMEAVEQVEQRTEQQQQHDQQTKTKTSPPSSTTTPRTTTSSLLPPIVSQNYQCRPYAIVYLVQKHHSSYNRNSFGLLERSLDLLYQNYMLVNDHYLTTNVFLFHEGDFDTDDLIQLEQRYPSETTGTLQLVNLTGTEYWQLPSHLQNDDTSTWRDISQYNMGYRHMIRWYAIKIWDFFAKLNQVTTTRLSTVSTTSASDHDDDCVPYSYIMRMDEESNLLSRVDYNLADFLSTNNYNYAFRQCSHEMGAVMGPWKRYLSSSHYFTTDIDDDDAVPQEPLIIHRQIYGQKKLCGFYNNFFIAKLDFMSLQPQVQQFLRWVDAQDIIYRDRVNDLVLHTVVAMAFSPPEQIHRFLDFTYEHWTMTVDGKCPRWGGLSIGYNDLEAGQEYRDEWWERVVVANDCPTQQKNPSDRKDAVRDFKVRMFELSAEDLSPTYQHALPSTLRDGRLRSFEVAAGMVNLPETGIQSG